MKQRAGKTCNQVAKIPEDNGSFQIKTSSADIVVYGTSFLTEVDESGKTLVQTVEGLVTVSAQNEVVLVTEGQQTEVEADEAPALPTPIPPAKNELVFTINEPAIGFIIDPSGSSVGYLPDGSPLNEISGSHLSTPEEPYHTVRLREPQTGEYAIVLRGAVDGTTSINIEGFAEGESTFVHAESANVSSANDLVLKLHLDVLDGLIAGAAALAPEATEDEKPVVSATPQTSEPEGKPDGDKEAPAETRDVEKTDKDTPFFHPDSDYKLNPWIVIASVIVLFAIIFTIVWRRT